MLVTLEGMTISDRESQPENAPSPMLVTLDNHGKTKSARIQKRNVFSTDKNEM